MSTTRKRRAPLAYRILAACETAHHDRSRSMSPLDVICNYATIGIFDWQTYAGLDWYLAIENLVPKLAAAGYLDAGAMCQKEHSLRGTLMLQPTYGITEKGRR